MGIILRWEGGGVNEEGIIDSINKEKFESSTSQQLKSSTLSESGAIIEVDPQYFRPTEVEMLLGDPSRAKERLGWEPNYAIKELVVEMVEKDFKNI